AKEKKIEIKVINNASILNAVGILGLELYKYGKTTSMPFFENNFKPESPYDAVKENLERGLHTLVLLDIKKDLSKFMPVNVALEQFLEIEKKRKEKVFSSDLKVVGCARIGSESQLIKYGFVKDLIAFDFGKPLHCLIVPGKLHFMEEEMLNLWI
ncbi:MAG: diphthine synthase, partial [Candidatus Woesearchaeota archaeon]